MNILDRFEQKFFDVPGLTEWLFYHRLEMWRYLQKRYTGYNDQIYNARKFMTHDQSLGYLLVNDDMVSPVVKMETILQKIRDESLVAQVVGRKGGGKSAFGAWLIDQVRFDTKCYWMEANYELPKWLEIATSWDDVENDSLVIVDEAGLTYNSRRAMGGDNVDMSKMLMVSRHRGLKVLFITQSFNITDINIHRLSDMFFFKPLQLTEHIDADSTRSKAFYRFVVQMMPIDYKQTLFTDGEQWFRFENTLPDWWSETISKSYTKLTYDQAREFAESLSKDGMSRAQILSRLSARGARIQKEELDDLIRDNPSISKHQTANYVSQTTGRPICPKCNKNDTFKYGKVGNQQKWRCKSCGKVSYTEI